MNNLSVSVHVRSDIKPDVRLRATEYGHHVIASLGGADIYIHDREKLLELASLLEKAAQEWECEV